MLHRQPSSKDQARKSWGPILGLRYFGPAKVVKERVGGEQNSWHLTAQAKKRGLTVTWSTRCKRCRFGHPLTPFLTPLVPEMSVVLKSPRLDSEKLESVSHAKSGAKPTHPSGE